MATQNLQPKSHSASFFVVESQYVIVLHHKLSHIKLYLLLPLIKHPQNSSPTCMIQLLLGLRALLEYGFFLLLSGPTVLLLGYFDI